MHCYIEMLKLETILKNYDDFYTEEPLITERLLQDMKSAYIDIRQFVANGDDSQDSAVDFSDIEFRIKLLKTDEINLDYILKLISEKTKETNNTAELQEILVMEFIPMDLIQQF